ncbi:MAG: BamA/TamA family outer membrane protein [Planctomycetales bacterium]|nr:BamA/TamA family outer membrane protein [Planctomycetales bacterium]
MAATKPLPELEIEAGEPIMRAQSPAPSAPAANYWNDYQVPQTVPSASNNTWNDPRRQPMRPSGSPVYNTQNFNNYPAGGSNNAAPQSGFAPPSSPQSSYGAPTYAQPAYNQPAYNQPAYTQPAYSQPAASQTAPSYPSYNPASQPNASTTVPAPTYSTPTYSTPGYNVPQYAPQYSQSVGVGGAGGLPPSNYSSAPPVMGEPIPPGQVIGDSVFPPDVFPPSVIAGEQSLPEVPIDVIVNETRTGRFMFGMGVNSDAGVTGQIVLDERNFDLFNPPTSLADIMNGTGWRGGGQGFRLEAIPGNQVQRYMASFTDPYLFGFLPYSLNVSGFLYDRIFRDWNEERFGGRLAIGNRLTPDLSMSVAMRAEQVKITNPRILGVPQLDAALGENDLYGGSITLTRDTRDLPFAPTQGSLIELTYEQMFGDYDYPRASLDLRQYFLMRERPDGSGRHTLAFSFRVGASGEQTPIFENYFAGGFSTLRGYAFRGASPIVNGVIVGGRFQFLGSVEYMFPLTADDMVKGVVFTDFGTVEENIEIDPDHYRVAPGVGLRISVPALGPAPLAFDFAFPIHSAPTDNEQVFSFFFGFGR